MSVTAKTFKVWYNTCMAFTQADLDAINAAIVRGEKSVQFADRLVVYRSLDELVKAKGIVEQELGGRPRQSLGRTKTGFECN